MGCCNQEGLGRYGGRRLGAGVYKSAERNEKVNESVFLDFGGKLAFVHQCRADGFAGTDAKKRLFLVPNGRKKFKLIVSSYKHCLAFLV